MPIRPTSSIPNSIMLAPENFSSPSSSDFSDEDLDLSTKSGFKSRSRIGVMILILSLSTIINTILIVKLRSRSSHSDTILPAEDVIENRIVTFDPGFGHSSVYEQPPSQAVDKAWTDLYRFALSTIPMKQAEKLPDRVFAIPEQPDHAVVSLDVFHQLHCLDILRRAMHSEHYQEMNSEDEKIYTRHCISALRQSIMCSADVSPIVWQWSERAQSVKERADIAHSCRDFEKIRAWSEKHAFGGVNTQRLAHNIL